MNVGQIGRATSDRGRSIPDTPFIYLGPGADGLGEALFWTRAPVPIQLAGHGYVETNQWAGCVVVSWGRTTLQGFVPPNANGYVLRLQSGWRLVSLGELMPPFQDVLPDGTFPATARPRVEWEGPHEWALAGLIGTPRERCRRCGIDRPFPPHDHDWETVSNGAAPQRRQCRLCRVYAEPLG